MTTLGKTLAGAAKRVATGALFLFTGLPLSGQAHAEPPVSVFQPPLDTGDPEEAWLDELWPHPAPPSSPMSPAPAGSSLGQSRGRANDGTLVGGVQLPDGEGYFRRRPGRSWATSSTVHHLQAAIARVHEQFPELHRLSVGDLSHPDGGPISGHRSHQSGRDVDLGFYYRERPFFYPLAFAPAHRDTLHFRATWALLEALADSADAPDGIEYVLLDYQVQGMLHRWALAEEIDPAVLDRVLQYPHGQDADRGIVRHYPNHSDHLHVRFKCPPQDVLCIASESLHDLRERMRRSKTRQQRTFEVASDVEGM